jgi:exonuclease SbcC
LRKELAAAESQVQELTNAFRSILALHWPDYADQPIQSMFEFLRTQSQETELQRMMQLRREITDAQVLWQSTEAVAVARQLEAAELASDAADKALQLWLDTIGQRLASVFLGLASFFSDLPSPIQNRPEHARTYARKVVAEYLERCQQSLARDTEERNCVAVVEQDRNALNERLIVLDAQIALLSKEAGQLAQALSGLISHVHSDDCPVCSRNFREVSDTPLLGHLAARVAALTQSAGRLTALSEERSNTLGAITARNRELADTQARLLADDSKQELTLRMATLLEALKALDELEEEAKRGERLFVERASAVQALATLRAHDKRSTSIRESAGRFAHMLSLEPIGTNESLRAALERFEAHVQEREKQLTAKESDRRSAEAILRELDLKHQSIEDIRLREKKRKGDCSAMNTAMAAGDRTIDQARNLLKLAQAERTLIVSRVFNESLNDVWRDLFVRLAPDEPFVPAFALPGSGKHNVEAKLETHYRNGGKGGNPRAMLSAGNLNTAALTLFLALHLSVKPHLPWLIIDDPVQSMDEVHISQFAALLRTLAKQHGRQIVIAVHEKPLFDYLCLELSPAFSGDRLITVELGRTADGNSVGVCNVRDWKPDLAIAA